MLTNYSFGKLVDGMAGKVQINLRTTAKDFVKMLEESDTKVCISTVKQVLYQHNMNTQQGRTHCSKTAITNKARIWFTTILRQRLTQLGQSCQEE